MKRKLLKVLDEMIDLLQKCNFPDKADWLVERQDRLKRPDITSSQFKQIIMELQNVIAGMGSFSDLVLVPKEGAGMDEDEAESIQKRLGSELFQTVETLLGTTS